MWGFSEQSCDVAERTAEPMLSIFQVMPRGMYFGCSAATSIDLCVHDLVLASRYRHKTQIFAEDITDPFDGFDVEPLPRRSGAMTFARANSVARAARRMQPDIIVVQQHLPTAAAIARRLPCTKVVLHTHNFQKSYGSPGLSWRGFRRANKRWRYERLAGLLHVSRASQRHFSKEWPDLALPDCVVSNGLDFSNWMPKPVRSQEILYAGRCAPEKRVLEAAQALASLLPAFPSWRTRFLLSSPEAHPDYAKALKNVLAPLGPQAVIEEQKPFAEVKAAFESAAIALVPSEMESFGRAALEAHAGGAALISSGAGGLTEVSGDCAFVPTRITPETLAEAIRLLIGDCGLRRRLAREGTARVHRHYSIEAQAAKLDGFLERIVAHSNSEGSAFNGTA